MFKTWHFILSTTPTILLLRPIQCYLLLHNIQSYFRSKKPNPLCSKSFIYFLNSIRAIELKPFFLRILKVCKSDVLVVVVTDKWGSFLTCNSFVKCKFILTSVRPLRFSDLTALSSLTPAESL